MLPALEGISFASVGAIATTVGLVLTRPKIGRIRLELTLSAAIGVVVMLCAGLLGGSDLLASAGVMWRPLLTLIALMLITSVAQHLGILTVAASWITTRSKGDAHSLFFMVFILGAITSAVLNNDSAILCLTPLVILIVKERYPKNPEVLPIFAFAVFIAAGVAPFMVSNPMNLIVATYAGINFNQYAAVMVPVAIAGWITSYLLLLMIARPTLATLPIIKNDGVKTLKFNAAQFEILALLSAVMLAYPIFAWFGANVWLVTVGGAFIAVLIGLRHRVVTVRSLAINEIGWDILGFLFCAYLLGNGLQNAGIIGWLSTFYATTGIWGIGAISAFGSAVANNHPMAIINMLAVSDIAGSGHREIFAALIGGDLGPRLLPTGSLAGLLWLQALRRQGVKISLRQFITIGFYLTIPTLAISLLLIR